MAVLLWAVLFLAMAGPSSGATYCVCRRDVSTTAQQTALDFACGHGADCSAIQSQGSCYNPITVPNHCDYAVNSYFQKYNQASTSCAFNGAAVTSSSPPSNLPSTCSFLWSSSTSGTPSIVPPGTTTTPPSTMLSPPGMTLSPPGMTLSPPSTTFSPPSTTRSPPSTTFSPPGSTMLSPPGSATLSPPGSTTTPVFNNGGGTALSPTGTGFGSDSDAAAVENPGWLRVGGVAAVWFSVLAALWA